MSAHQTIYVYLNLTAILGVLSAALPSGFARDVEAAWLILSVAVPYVWFYLDVAEHGFERTPGWSAGIILLSFIAVPMYLVKSREQGRRLKALGKALLVFCLSVLLPILGGALYGHFFAGA